MAVLSPGDVKDVEMIGSWFAVTLDNGIDGNFSDVSGLSIEVVIVEQKTTTKMGDTLNLKRPGVTTYGDIVLKRNLTADKKFWEWAKKIRDGKLDYRTNGAIVIYDMSGTEIGRYTFTNAWPSKWSASDLDVGSDDVMTEEVTLAIEALQRTK